jgi:hypothetical protein
MFKNPNSNRDPGFHDHNKNSEIQIIFFAMKKTEGGSGSETLVDPLYFQYSSCLDLEFVQAADPESGS